MIAKVIPLIQLFTFSYDKDIRATITNTIIYFYLFFQAMLCILTVTSSRYCVYHLPGKVENSSFLTQICPKNGFRFGISENKSQNENQYPRDLGLKYEKTNIEMRIKIFEMRFGIIELRNRVTKPSYAK